MSHRCEVSGEVCGAVILFSFTSDADAGSELQRAAVVQKEEEGWFQWGEGGGGENRENPQMYRGESAVVEHLVL